MKSVQLWLFKKNKNISEASIFKLLIWEMFSILAFQNRLSISYFLKTFILRIFGARVGKGVVIKQGVTIKYPWKLRIGDHCWIGEGAWIDNIAEVHIGNNVCISQGAYLCTGNHDWSKEEFPLTVRGINIEDGVWVGAKALVCPGINLKTHSVLTAGSVATSDTEAYKIYQGNPAKPVKEREIV